MSEPREWILRKGDFKPTELNGGLVLYNGDDYYHVIEYSALIAELEAERERSKILETYIENIAKLPSSSEPLVEAAFRVFRRRSSEVLKEYKESCE